MSRKIDTKITREIAKKRHFLVLDIRLRLSMLNLTWNMETTT